MSYLDRTFVARFRARGSVELGLGAERGRAVARDVRTRDQVVAKAQTGESGACLEQERQRDRDIDMGRTNGGVKTIRVMERARRSSTAMNY